MRHQRHRRHKTGDGRWEKGARFRFGKTVGFDGSKGKRLIGKDCAKSGSLMENQ